MRITQRSYQKACVAVEQARNQMKVVKLWEDAVRRLGDLGHHKLVAVTVSEDGSLKTECELANNESVSISEQKQTL